MLTGSRLSRARSPNLNAFAERFVLSVKSECLDRMVPLGEAHPRAAVGAFVDHYHQERPHQGLGNELIAAKTTLDRNRAGAVPSAPWRHAQVLLPRRGPRPIFRTQRDSETRMGLNPFHYAEDGLHESQSTADDRGSHPSKRCFRPGCNAVPR